MRRGSGGLVAVVLVLACGSEDSDDEGGGTDASTSTATSTATSTVSSMSMSMSGSMSGGPTSMGPTTDPDPGTDSAGSSTGVPPIEVTCTQVIGYSQVNEWYNGGGVFEGLVDDASWQLLWNGGAGVDRWQMPDYEGWDNDLNSPCTMNSDAPERVLLSVSGGYMDDEVAWAEAIEATIAQIEAKIPSVEQIVLQPVVGGPNHETCQFGGVDIRASWQHAHIDNAIANVVGGNVVAGFSPEVETCEDYEDSLGHLTDDGAIAAAQTIGEFYADW